MEGAAVVPDFLNERETWECLIQDVKMSHYRFSSNFKAHFKTVSNPKRGIFMISSIHCPDIYLHVETITDQNSVVGLAESSGLDETRSMQIELGGIYSDENGYREAFSIFSESVVEMAQDMMDRVAVTLDAEDRASQQDFQDQLFIHRLPLPIDCIRHVKLMYELL